MVDFDFMRFCLSPLFRLLWAGPQKDAGWCPQSRLTHVTGRQQTNPVEEHQMSYKLRICTLYFCKYLTLHEIDTVSEVVAPHDLLRQVRGSHLCWIKETEQKYEKAKQYEKAEKYEKAKYPDFKNGCEHLSCVPWWLNHPLQDDHNFQPFIFAGSTEKIYTQLRGRCKKKLKKGG